MEWMDDVERRWGAAEKEKANQFPMKTTAVRKLSAASQYIHRVGKLNFITRNEMRLVSMRLLIVINKREIDWVNSREVAPQH